MGLAGVGETVQALCDHGMSPGTPAAAVHGATTGSQRTVEAPLGQLETAIRAAGLTSPTLLIVGPVVRLRAQLAWFEQRPLFGKRVLVTRPQHQAGDLVPRQEE